MFEKGLVMMELYIETLTGTAFELRVSPYETIQDVKMRIQKLEGIPLSQQHLIWQNMELEDDYSLQDYAIGDGATLKLVLTMRGGPINTRRIVPVEDPTLRDMAEYLTEANRDEILEKMPTGNRPVTVIVYHNGEQLNFFRVVDRDSASPLSESLSGASMYNLYDDDDDDSQAVKEKVEENDKTREKMKVVRSKMENLTLTKKQPKKKYVPRPPSSGRPGSKNRLRRFTSSAGTHHTILNKNQCLPPVGKTLPTTITTNNAIITPPVTEPIKSDPSSAGSVRSIPLDRDLSAKSTDAVASLPNSASSSRRKFDATLESAKHRVPLTSVREDEGDLDNNRTTASSVAAEAISALIRKQLAQTNTSSVNSKYELSNEVLLRDNPKLPSPRKKENISIDSLQETLSKQPPASARRFERLLSDPGRTHSSNGRSSVTSHKDKTLEALKETLGRPSSKRPHVERKSGSGMVLESLNPSEVRAVSGMLTNFVRSASRNSRGYPLNETSMATPENRLSARLQRLSASRDGKISPTHRLPRVKSKKKTSKRCLSCGKKTGLATSYMCRCGNNFCSTHRLPESHDCTFDYKTEGRKLLEQSNPVVTAPKLPKI